MACVSIEMALPLRTDTKDKEKTDPQEGEVSCDCFFERNRLTPLLLLFDDVTPSGEPAYRRDDARAKKSVGEFYISAGGK